jgi:hypothetical protein
MRNKTTIAITAAILLGSVTMAFTYESPEDQLSSRFQFLDQGYQRTATPRTTARSAVRVTPRRTSALDPSSLEAPEDKIADRFPLLEQGYTPTARVQMAVILSTPRQTALGQLYNDAPENKLADRYPFLEQQIALQRSPLRVINTARARTSDPVSTGSIR